jgi:hypothetical protein
MCKELVNDQNYGRRCMCTGILKYVVQFVVVAQSVLAIFSCRHFVIAEAEVSFEQCAGQ